MFPLGKILKSPKSLEVNPILLSVKTFLQVELIKSNPNKKLPNWFREIKTPFEVEIIQ